MRKARAKKKLICSLSPLFLPICHHRETEMNSMFRRNDTEIVRFRNHFWPILAYFWSFFLAKNPLILLFFFPFATTGDHFWPILAYFWSIFWQPPTPLIFLFFFPFATTGTRRWIQCFGEMTLKFCGFAIIFGRFGPIFGSFFGKKTPNPPFNLPICYHRETEMNSMFRRNDTGIVRFRDHTRTMGHFAKYFGFFWNTLTIFIKFTVINSVIDILPTRIFV